MVFGGGGSAFSDLIVPAPITGGILHVPSMVVALALLNTYRKSPDATAAVLRTVLLSATLVGVLMLINLERLFLALTTDMEASAFRMHKNYMGLFIASDAFVAWAWTQFDRRGDLDRARVLGVLAAPAIGYIIFALSGNDRVGADFLHGRMAYQPERGDAIYWIYTRHESLTEEQRLQALEFMSMQHPNQNPNYQDLALYFTTSLHDAKEHAPDAVPLFSACLYEDQTPTRWETGAADCFTEHQNFSERMEQAYAHMPKTLPNDVKNYFVAVGVCEQVVIDAEPRFDIEDQNYCRYARLDEKRADIVAKHGEAILETSVD